MTSLLLQSRHLVVLARLRPDADANAHGEEHSGHENGKEDPERLLKIVKLNG